MFNKKVIGLNRDIYPGDPDHLSNMHEPEIVWVSLCLCQTCAKCTYDIPIIMSQICP